MTPLYMFFAFIIALLSGFIGALLGLGGGIILVPLLVFLLDVPIQIASGASIIAVVATSSAATSVYIKDNLTNMRLGMFLELSTTLGAITGASLLVIASESTLMKIFGLSLIFASIVMGIQTKNNHRSWNNKHNDWLATNLQLGNKYWDDARNEFIEYGVQRTLPTIGVSFIAGIVSGLLGIGGGGVKVPALNAISGVPMKVAVATSNFMVGITATASAFFFIKHGFCNYFLTAPVVLGALLGSYSGATMVKHFRGIFIKRVFVVVILFLGLRMIF
jgi:uncharacterized membrane protein YfcA